MFDEDRLGSADGFTKWKGIYLLYILAVFGILFYGTLAAAQPVRDTIYFYIIFGAILGLVPLIIDNLSKNREKLDEVDTVSMENNAPGIFSVRNQLIIAVLLSTLLVFRFSSTGSVWVSAPQFGVFDSHLGNAFLSGAVGIIENLVFFGFVFSTAYAFIFKRTEAGLIALMGSLLISVFVFTGYHTIRYGTNESALFAVASFALVNSLLVYFTRSLVISDSIHFSNNFISMLFQINKVAFSVSF